MLDKTNTPPLPSSGIPVISPILHVLVLPVLVFLRFGLGFAFLRPKAIFFSLILATVLLSYIVWHDDRFAEWFGTISRFSLAASALYLGHLIVNIAQQKARSAHHDQESGTSWLGLLLPGQRSRSQILARLAGEPCIAATVGYVLKPDLLGPYLLLCAAALPFKELIRIWIEIRNDQRLNDSYLDASKTGTATRSTGDLPKCSGRTEEESSPPRNS